MGASGTVLRGPGGGGGGGGGPVRSTGAAAVSTGPLPSALTARTSKTYSGSE